ncbi:MAG: phytanoyl-CoA dioxygenase family protein [Steroidobacteraceae bacterium]|nr:phytanoyl-CoA dioxygenase family protein [Steroidobacteraceae bacterium]
MDDGYEIISDVFPVPEVEALAATLETLPLDRSRAGARHLLRHSSIADLSQDARLTSIASRVLGGAARPHSATLFDKSPRANWLVAWHQDTTLPMRERIDLPGWGPWSEKGGVLYAHAPASVLSRVVALRIHLDDSTSDNGALRVLPRSHTLGVLTDDQVHDLAARSTHATCLIGRGGVIAMRPLIVHASSKVMKDAPRRVIHIEYSTQ